jgi:hypothetical protein
MTSVMGARLAVVPLLMALAACSAPAPVSADQAAQNADKPGWTGRTFVVGSNSTVAGDAGATYIQQKWGVGRQR